MWMELLTTPETYVSLLTLTALEIVLGIDNIVFISILAERLPVEKRNGVRQMGLLMAIIGRLGLLSMLAFLTHLTQPLFTLFHWTVSAKDLVLVVGGLFLIAKSASEIYDKVEGTEEGHEIKPGKGSTVMSVLLQIMLLDVVFSLDSIITAVGLVAHIPIMVVAILLSVAIMMLSVNHVAGIIEKHPSIKVLALSFLLLIGTLLVAEGLHQHVPKGYVYFALGFSVFVEFLKIKADPNQRLDQKPKSA